MPGPPLPPVPRQHSLARWAASVSHPHEGQEAEWRYDIQAEHYRQPSP